MSDSEPEPETNWWSSLDRNGPKGKFKFHRQSFERLIQEIFLPRKLSNSYDTTNVYENESRMLALLTVIIQELNNELPQSTQNLFKTWSFLQCRPQLEAIEIQNAIASLKRGDMFALYIHKQNCGFCLYIPSDSHAGGNGSENKAIVSTFNVSLRNEQIMSTVNDLQMSFPAISVAIPFDNFVKSLSFAEQLITLDEKQFEKAMPKGKKAGIEVIEIRDVADPMFVSKWLLAFLTNENSQVVLDSDFPRIVKKIRDDVIYTGGELPFRRSGLWMTMKVVLRLNLAKEFGSAAGQCIYKIIQIQLASKMCEFWLRDEYKIIDSDLAIQMLAKVGRKLDKLTTTWKSSLDKLQCESLYLSVTNYAKETIIKVREKVNHQFNQLDISDRHAAQLKPLGDMNFQSDTIHKIPSLSAYIGTRLEAMKSPPRTSGYLSEPQQIPRHRGNVPIFPSYSKLSSASTEVDVCLILADIENWVCEHLYQCTIGDALRLRNLAIEYGVAAKKHYQNDPLGGSRAILTILQIIRTLDEIATDEYPLLAQHHSGINPNLIEDLLLPSRDQLMAASVLEIYFKQRNSEAKFPPLNGEYEVSRESFSVRYAKGNSEMIALLQTILNVEKKKIEEKIVEVNQGRLKVQNWRKEAEYLTHEYTKYWDQYDFRTDHDHNCRLCKLKRKSSKYKVGVYERVLRREEHCQYAVAFELLIPIQISCLRDVLQFAAEEFLFSTKPVNELNIKGSWIDHHPISYHKRELDRRVYLGSTCLLYMKSHYAKEIHPDSEDSKFIVNNGYNCVYYGSKKNELSNDIEKQTVKKFCSFRVELNSPYENLQWTLLDTKHFQNEVLARQKNCAFELTLPEYIAFGSLRSDGHRLQMRNIYRALATEALSFEKESVVALILQSLWQAGPNSDNWVRESHEDLCDAVFATEMIELLTKYVSLQQENWKHPFKMMIAILIATRILELNDNAAVVQTTVNLLLYCRCICDDWITRIQTAKSKCDCNELSEIENLRTNMVDVSLCCALTFYASPKLKTFSQLWESSTTTSALSYWLRAIVTVNNNIIMSAVGMSTFSNFRRIFLRAVRIIGINSETLLLNQITKGSSTDLNRFVASQWSGVRNGIFKQWKSFPNVQQVVYTDLWIRGDKVQQNYIQIDIILGTFFVNGLKISGLSEAITNSPSFQRVFGKTSFEVQPTENGKFCTGFIHNDCNYHFKMEGNQLIIQEERTSGDIFELIPNAEFGDDVPFILQNDYSHWWHLNKQSIEFRPVQFNVHNFTNSDQVQFELNLTTKCLTELKTSRHVIDRLSNSFQKIYEYLNRLESEKYVIAVMDGPDKVSIELPRMRIQFKVDGSNNEIMSHQYHGMQISRHQKFGTFIGLQNGLLLEHKDNGEQLLIMPHGKIEMKWSGKAHPVIWVDTKSLREPPFFIYDVDNGCQQLKTRGNFSAWFYLAHLHAVTSHELPDPFTGMRGAERALQILQSAFCWSSEPYDSESITTLCSIRQLSPNRCYYPPHLRAIQKIKWPENLPTSSSHEAYAIVVEHLIQDSERLKFLHFQVKTTDSVNEDFFLLNERSCRRYVCYEPNGIVGKYIIAGADQLPIHDSLCDSHNDDYWSAKGSEDSLNDYESKSEDSNYRSDLESSDNRSDVESSDNRSDVESSDNQSDVESSRKRSNIGISCESNDQPNVDDELENMRILAAFGHDHQFHVPADCAARLERLLITLEDLYGLTYTVTGHELITYMNSGLRDVWIDMYDIACNRKFDDVKFTLALTLLAFNGDNLVDLLILQAIAANPMEFQAIRPPNVQLYSNLFDDNLDRSRIFSDIASCGITKDDYLLQFEGNLKQVTDVERTFLLNSYTLEWMEKTKSQCEALTALVEKQWPCNACNLSSISAPQINKDEAMVKINPLLKMWYENNQLKLFLAQVAAKLQKLSEQSTEPKNLKMKNFVYEVAREDIRPKYRINFAQKIARNFNNNMLVNELKAATRLFEQGKSNDEDDMNILWERIKQLSMPDGEDYLNAANVYPRLVPTLILPQMISSTNQNQRTMIGAFGVLLSLDKRANRLKKLKQQQPHMEVALRREIEENPFSDWFPIKYPQWLLFEIENDLTIRRIQIKVAQRMIAPPEDRHSVMQLNMGEGKTAVIIPLLAAVLSNKKHVCQVTVLKSLFKGNLKLLRQCLGGMLNRRIYTFPCRRDMVIKEDDAQLLLDSYNECMEHKGVIMTLPEYRLSFQLKLYEMSRKGELETASVLFQTHKWLNENVRNILDESDAILNAKYQLIYTVGKQLLLDGGELRWVVIQNILKTIPSNMKILWDKHGNEKIEFDQHFDLEEGKEKFCPCRILHPSVYDELRNNIANDFIEERTRITFPKLKTSEKSLVKEVIFNRNVDGRTYNECMKIFEAYPVYKDVIFLLSGLLKCEVLHFVLKKRWRVNYGINPNGHRKMAVPFVAKDVCAENTEFGHPDVAICFTYLSYYYSGLTDAQLLNCFDILSKLSNSDAKYNEWISCMPNHKVHRSIRMYSGINLSDASQRIILFDSLRYNMNVIDFWLSNVVFPREAIQFDGKLMCTAWDLCSEEMMHVVTGFSGTNDTKLLLPQPIIQNDLKELEDTNEKVRLTIIQEENDDYDHLESNISGLEILQKLVDNRIPVLLDSGALMLELSNEQVAKQWLKLVPNHQFDAAIYFSDRDVLLVVDRQNCQREFDFSPYIDRLDRCIVYLDDAHTRGTDLKFPRGAKACVTLCGGITRDKTVQACMRMRLLGQGHTICFWGSEEADNSIREHCEKKKADPIFTTDVFNWICHNSRVFENDGLVHWSAAAYNYSQKLAAYRYIQEDVSDDGIKDLSDRCTDKEILKLADLYGGKREISVVAIFEKRFSSLIAKYSNKSDIESFVTSKSDFVINQLRKYIPNVKRFSQILDEEQEKELEHELEEHREVQRPGKAYAVKPVINEELEEFLRHGLRNREFLSRMILNKSIISLPKALENTSLWSSLHKQERKWSNEIYVTADFMNVVNPKYNKADEFLRPVWWIVSANLTEPTSKQLLILLSPFEVNHFIRIFRGDSSATTLRMYSPRLLADQHTNAMVNRTALQLPFTSNSVDINGHIESQLSVFAGSIYFQNKVEMENYCTFLGIIPSPFTEEHQKAFDQGQIGLNGFVRPGCRNICEKIKNGCPFKKNPDELVRGIIERRHSFLPKNSHVSKIVIEGTITGIKYGNESN